MEIIEAFIMVIALVCAIAIPFGIGVAIMEAWVYSADDIDLLRIDGHVVPTWRATALAPTGHRTGIPERIAQNLTVEDMEFTTPEFDALIAQLEDRLWLNELAAQDGWGDEPIMVVWCNASPYQPVWLDEFGNELDADPDPDEYPDHYAHIVAPYNDPYNLPFFSPMRRRKGAYNDTFLAERKEVNAQARRRG